MDFNTAFSNTLDQIRASCPGITIYSPDMFALLDQVHASPADYGLTRTNIDAWHDPALADKSLDGPGASYVWWDGIDPSAKFHAHMASLTQQLLSPVRITGISAHGASNRLDLVNIPVGRNGFVEQSSTFANWATAAGIESTNTTVTVFIPASEPLQFYRLRFPFSWTWP